MLAEFSSLDQWQRQQQVLAQMPGVRNLQVGSLSGRSASIALSYPGGGEALQAALGSQELTLERCRADGARRTREQSNFVAAPI